VQGRRLEQEIHGAVVQRVRVGAPFFELHRQREVFDKFHVVAKISEAMDTVRRNEYARFNGKQRKFIKGRRFNLPANRGTLSRKAVANWR
jgi:transposase